MPSGLLAACASGPQGTLATTGGGRPASQQAVDSTAYTELAAAPAPHLSNPVLAGEPVPRYDVVAKRSNDRSDRGSTYYVVIDPIDPGIDAFKAAVKQVLRVIASVNPGPNFSAYIWDEILAAQTEVAYQSMPDRFSDEQFSAKETRNEFDLIARYEGGLVFADEPPAYVVSWFPHAGAQSPEVGRWVSAEPWRP